MLRKTEMKIIVWIILISGMPWQNIFLSRRNYLVRENYEFWNEAEKDSRFASTKYKKLDLAHVSSELIFFGSSERNVLIVTQKGIITFSVSSNKISQPSINVGTSRKLSLSHPILPLYFILYIYNVWCIFKEIHKYPFIKQIY